MAHHRGNVTLSHNREGRSSSTSSASQMNGDCHRIGDLMLRAAEGMQEVSGK